MSWPYSLVKVVATGDLLTAADYNNEHTNHINNNIPSSIDDASATTTDFQTTTNPFPGGGISLPTDLAGEIQMLRFQLGLLTGSVWYVTTPFGQNIDSLARNNQFHTHQGGTVTVAGSEFYYNGPTLDGTAAITPATITGASIAANTITGSNFVDGSITTAKITDANITTAKIADVNVTEAKLSSGVTTKLNKPFSTTVPAVTTASASPVSWTYNTLPGQLEGFSVSSGDSATCTVTIDGVAIFTSGTFSTVRFVDAAGNLSTTFIPCTISWNTSITVSVSSGSATSKTITAYYRHQ